MPQCRKCGSDLAIYRRKSDIYTCQDCEDKAFEALIILSQQPQEIQDEVKRVMEEWECRKARAAADTLNPTAKKPSA